MYPIFLNLATAHGPQRMVTVYSACNRPSATGRRVSLGRLPVPDDVPAVVRLVAGVGRRGRRRDVAGRLSELRRLAAAAQLLRPEPVGRGRSSAAARGSRAGRAAAAAALQPLQTGE